MRQDVWTSLSAYTPHPRRCSHCDLILAVKKVVNTLVYGCAKCDVLYLSTLARHEETA